MFGILSNVEKNTIKIDGIFLKLFLQNIFKWDLSIVDKIAIKEHEETLKAKNNMFWTPVIYIEKKEDYVYDFSLDDIDGDAWCHSVLYNGIVGHQTPKG